MRRGGLGGLILLCAAAGAGELHVAEGAVKKAAALARPAVVTVFTRDQNDLDLTGVVIAPGIVLTTRSPLVKDSSVPTFVTVRLPGKGATVVDAGDVRVGIIGVMTEGLASVVQKDKIRGLRTLDARETVQSLADSRQDYAVLRKLLQEG